MHSSVNKNESRTFFGHPYPLGSLFFTEMWERFSFYGIRPLLILFMAATVYDGGMGLARENASAIVGIFAGSMYLAALPGGWLADNWLGQQRAVWYGSILIALGHLSIALSAWLGNDLFFIGLMFIVLGSRRSMLGRKLLNWINVQGLKVEILGEFDDAALMKAFGAAHNAIFVAPTLYAHDFYHDESIVEIGRMDSVMEEYHAIFAERMIQHPGAPNRKPRASVPTTLVIPASL